VASSMRKKMPYARDEAKSWARQVIHGFIQDPFTPFKDDLTFDAEGMRYNIQKILDEVRPDGLIYGGNFGECWNMTAAQYKEYMTVSAEETKGKTLLAGIVIDPSPYGALEKIRLMEDLGYDCVEIMTPVYQVRSDEDIMTYFKLITDNTDMAVMLYNTPASGRLLGNDLIKCLADIDTVIGVKHGKLNWMDTMRLRQVIGDKMLVCEPVENYWLMDILFGGPDGGKFIWATIELTLYGRKRHLLKEYTELARKGESAKAFELYKQLAVPRLLQEDQLYWSIFQKGLYSIAGVKYWFELLGFKAGPVLPPQKGLTEAEKDEIRQTLEADGVI
jgi:4-hydroxy-tetrahydrodipicolinate synthase